MVSRSLRCFFIISCDLQSRAAYIFYFFTLSKGMDDAQWWIFIFGVLGYFKLGVLLEGLGQLRSYKLAPHVLVTFTEQVLPIHKHISYFILNSLVIRNKHSHIETNEKGSREVIWPHTHCIFIEYLTGLV